MGWERLQHIEVTSGESSVELRGIYDSKAAIVVCSGVELASNSYFKARLTKTAGGNESSNNYKWAYSYMRADASYNTSSSTDTSFHPMSTIQGSHESGSIIIWLYNMFNSSLYPAFHVRHGHKQYNTAFRSYNNYGLCNVAQSYDGIRFFANSGNINGGKFTLYRVD